MLVVGIAAQPCRRASRRSWLSGGLPIQTQQWCGPMCGGSGDNEILIVVAVAAHAYLARSCSENSSGLVLQCVHQSLFAVLNPNAGAAAGAAASDFDIGTSASGDASVADARIERSNDLAVPVQAPQLVASAN